MLSDRLAGAAASAFYGGWSAARVVHTPAPAVLVDRSAAYLRDFSLLGVQRYLTAMSVHAVDATSDMRAFLCADDLRARLLDRHTWAYWGAKLVRVHPYGAVGPVKALRDGEARLAMAPLDVGGDTCWWHWCDVVAGILLGGPMPEIVEAVRFMPQGICEDVRPLILPTDRTVDLTTDDVALAMVAERQRIADDASIGADRRQQRLGLLKLTGNALAFGNLARVDRDSCRTPILDMAIGPDGERVEIRTHHPERPGPYTSLLLAGAVTSAARLAAVMAMDAIEAAGGCWMHLATDSLLIAATHADEAELVPCPSGPIHVARRRFIRALPVGVISEALQRFDSLYCPDGAQAWKHQAGADRPLVGYVSGVYRFALVDPNGGDAVATEAALGGVHADPTGTGRRTADGHWQWAIDAHLAMARAGMAWDGRGPVPELDLPAWAQRLVLRPGQARTPDQLARLQLAFPERRPHPFIHYLQAVTDPLRPCDVVPVTLDTHLSPEQWLEADWRDARTGRPLILTTSTDGCDDAVRVLTVRELLHTWRLPNDATTEPIAPVRHSLEPGCRRTLPVHSRAELIQLVGKEGDDLMSLLINPAALTGDELTVYRQPDMWAPILQRARAVGAAELARRGLPRSTAYRIVGGTRPSADTMALVARIVDAAPEADGATFGWHPCARPGCDTLVAPRRKWCDRPGCRKAVWRAQDRMALAAMSATRCRRCGGVRFGVQKGPCPGCAAGGVETSGVECDCGVLRVGDLSAPCPACGRRAS